MSAVQAVLNARADLQRRLTPPGEKEAKGVASIADAKATWSRRATKPQLNALKRRRLFDEASYRRKTGLAPSDDAWAHFVNEGRQLGLEAHPLFDTKYARRAGFIGADVTVSDWFASDPKAADGGFSPLFDRAFYLETNEVQIAETETALEHYLFKGRAGGLITHPLIDPEWTASTWPDGLGNKFDLVEYVSDARFQQLSPTPLFDPAHYGSLNQANSDRHLFLSYLLAGENALRDPNPWIDESFYRRKNGPLAQGQSVLGHYVSKGRFSNALTHPVFDRDLYAQLYRDVVRAGVDPYTHFVAHGAREGRIGGHLMHQTVLSCGPMVAPDAVARALVGTGNAFDVLPTDWLEALAKSKAQARMSAGLRVLQRPFRVLRKRLRALGILKAPQSYTAGLSALAENAPQELKPFLTSLSAYEAWIHNNGMTEASRSDLLRRLDATRPNLRISIVTPVYNTPEVHLREMVASVQAQIYENWELCLVDDCSPTEKTWLLLRELAESDDRIRIERRTKNGGISRASNDAAALATGEVLALVDHDDRLTPDALAEIALYYADRTDADVVYSDDDKFDNSGARYAPQFKPDWSPTLLLTYMYMSHLFTVRRSLFEAVGGFRASFDGSQDYDFALRATEQARHVGHVSKVLYHWRATEGSTALSGDAKPESFQAGVTAVSEALQRRHIAATAYHSDWAIQTKVGMYSLAFPDDGPLVTIIIPTFNQVAFLRDCVESLSTTTYRNFEVLVIDNGSNDAETLAYLDEIRNRARHSVKVIPQRKSGFSFAALMNEAAQYARGAFLLFLNNDTQVIEPRWLSQMVGYGGMDSVGSVGAKLYFADGSVQHAGIVRGYNEGLVGHAFRNAPQTDWGYLGFMRTAREYSAVTAACMLTPRHVFENHSGFDGKRFAVAYNDADYGFRLVESGLRNIYCGEAELYHFEGKTRPKRDNPREIIALRSLYGQWVDPWYNANLTFDRENFQVSTRRSSKAGTAAIRVAFVSHSLNREGAPNTLLDLAIGLKQKGAILPIVFTPFDGPLRAAYEAEGIEVVLVSLPPADAGQTPYVAGLDTLVQAFVDRDVEVIISNTLTMYQAINAGERAGIATIWCQHESEPWETYFDHLSPVQRTFAYAAFGQAYRVTYVAEATRRAWKAVQTRANSQLIRHGIPAKRLDEEVSRWSQTAARAHLGLEPNEYMVLVAGTVCDRKGQIDVVSMLRAMPADDIARCRIFIAGAWGEAYYLGRLNQAISDLPDSAAAKVTLTGPVEDMTVYFAAADIYVCTSRIESAPRVIVEAMAFGLPIVTTPVFGIPELVDEAVNALFYQPEDFVSLAGHVSQLLNDPTLRSSFSDASPFVLRSRPGYAEMVSDYEDLIREAALLRTSR